MFEVDRRSPTADSEPPREQITELNSKVELHQSELLKNNYYQSKSAISYPKCCVEIPFFAGFSCRV